MNRGSIAAESAMQKEIAGTEAGDAGERPTKKVSRSRAEETSGVPRDRLVGSGRSQQLRLSVRIGPATRFASLNVHRQGTKSPGNHSPNTW